MKVSTTQLLARHLRHAVDRSLTASEFDQLVRDTVRRYLAHLLQFWGLPRADPKVVRNQIRLTRSTSQLGPEADGPLILVGPHIGNWDYALIALGQRRRRPVRLLAAPPQSDRIRTIVSSAYRRHGLDVVFLGEQAGQFESLAGWIDDGGQVMLLCDFTPDRGGVVVPFLDGHAEIPTGPARLALATGAAMADVSSWHADDGAVVVHVGSPMQVTRDASARDLMSWVASRMTDCIREHPADWHLAADYLTWVPRATSDGLR